MANYDIEVRDLVQRAAVEFAVEEFDESFGKLPDKLDEIAKIAAEEGKQFWSEEAGRMLNSTRQRYQQALHVAEDFSGAGGIIIRMHTEDELVVAIEEGRPGFDMKPGLLKGAALRVIPIGPVKDMRTVTSGMGDDKWMHPGWRGLKLVEMTDIQLDTVIIPKHLNELFDNL